MYPTFIQYTSYKFTEVLEPIDVDECLNYIVFIKFILLVNFYNIIIRDLVTKWKRIPVPP